MTVTVSLPVFAQGPDHCPQMNQVKGLCFSSSHSLLSCPRNVFICHLLCAALLCLIAQLCLTLCDPMDCSPPGSLVHGDCSCKNTEVGSLSLLQGIFWSQESNWGSPALQADSLPAELSRKPLVTRGAMCWVQANKNESEIMFAWKKKPLNYLIIYIWGRKL